MTDEKLKPCPLPQILETYPGLWYVTGDGIKTENGVWVCEGGGLNYRLVELANTCRRLVEERNTRADDGAALQALIEAGERAEKQLEAHGFDGFASGLTEALKNAREARSDGWQPIEKQLPPYDENVLFYTQDGNIQQDYWYDSERPDPWYTHWRPLLPSPTPIQDEQ